MSSGESEWQHICQDAVGRMGRFVFPFTTPISRSDDITHGYAWGTGSYVQKGAATVLLTNEHVAARGTSEYLAHLPTPGDEYVRIRAPFVSKPWPVDAALTEITDPILPHPARVLPAEFFDDTFRPIDNELLFWVGYPGTSASRFDSPTESNTRKSWFGSLQTPAVPFLSRALTDWPEGLPDGYVPGYHVLLDYPQFGDRDGHVAEAPSPHGMSGSLVWDTKRIACLLEGKEWAPEQARVCGILWATWDRPPLVVITPVQEFRELIVCDSAKPTGT